MQPLHADGGLALVIESEGPRTAFRYSTGSWCSDDDALFESLAPEALAKLFCRKRALRDVVLELQIDDVVFASCPTTAQRWQGEDFGVDYGWSEDTFAGGGDDDDDDESSIDKRIVADSTKKIDRGDSLDKKMNAEEQQMKSLTFSVVLAASRSTLRRVGGIERLRTAARDLCAALGHEEARAGYVSRQAEILATAESRQAALKNCSLARELAAVCDAAVRREKASIILNDWIEVGLEPVWVDEIENTMIIGRGIYYSPSSGTLLNASSRDLDEFDDDLNHGDDLDAYFHGFEDDLTHGEDENDDELVLDPRSGGGRRLGIRNRRHIRTKRSTSDTLLRRTCAALSSPKAGIQRSALKETLIFAPYETLLLFDENDADPNAPIWAGATPQLAAVARSADPRRSFRDLADDVGLPLDRVYDLARHLVRWRRASVATVVSDHAVYAVRPITGGTSQVPPLEKEDPDVRDALHFFGAASTYVNAKHKLAASYLHATNTTDTPITPRLHAEALSRATRAILRAIRRGHLYRLHTYALRIEGIPSAAFEAAALRSRGQWEPHERRHRLEHTTSSPTDFDRQRSDFAPVSEHSQFFDFARGNYHHNSAHQLFDQSDFLYGHEDVNKLDGDIPTSTSHDSNLQDFDVHRLLQDFRLLQPYFNGRHSVIDMSWREHLPVHNIIAVLKAFESLVITIQR